MKVLGLASYPVEAAATRYRLYQYVEPLRAHGIELTVSSFMNGAQMSNLYQRGRALYTAAGLLRSVTKRLSEVFRTSKFDVLLVQREAMFFGPPFFEMIYQYLGNLPMVLDLDDATYIPYTSPVYGKLGSSLKFFGKTDKLIRRSRAVVCGNRFIAEYVDALGATTAVIPTVVDLNLFRPVEKASGIPVIGWVGTHSTFPFLETLFPVLSRLASKYEFLLKIVGAGLDDIKVNGVDVVSTRWELGKEVADFQSIDIGLYPLTQTGIVSNDWLMGKSGFKAIQYLAIGIPFVMTPVGVCSELAIPGETHFNAATEGEWYASLEYLLANAAQRRTMGAKGREFAEENYDMNDQAENLATVLRDAAACG